MTIRSYPSSVVASVDVPEVRRFRAEFIYNFFVPEEKVDETSDVPKRLLETPSESLNSSFVEDLSLKKTIPRFIKISFKPIQSRANVKPLNEFVTNPDPAGTSDNISISENVDKVVSEDKFSTELFSSLTLQDDGLDGKLFLLTSGSISRKVSASNKNVLKQIERAKGRLFDDKNLLRASLQDNAKALNEVTEDDISSKFIMTSLNQIERLGAKFIDNDLQKKKTRKTFRKLRNVSLRSQFNNKIVGDVVQNIVNSPLGLLSDDLSPVIGEARDIQNDASGRFDPDNISASEFETRVESVRERKIDASEFQSSTRIIGYLIDKSEILEDGTIRKRDPIILESQSASETIDFEVAYGKTYTYSIRSVAQVDLQAIVEDSDEIVAATILISSKPSPRVLIECTEDIPPPVPVDFNIAYDKIRRSPRLMWCFPVNTQRDIKKFQVFRRSSLLEPFQLIKQFDFDDSVILSEDTETVEDSLVEKLDSPLTIFYDDEFKSDSKFIYAISSIDAHGLTSGYSAQFEVSFDRFSNNIVKKMISQSGAPKSYPNLYLLEDAFVDTIKDSNHRRLTIFFDPEYLDVINDEEESLNLLSTDASTGKYRMQFINTDLQQSEVLDIVIKDLRSTGEED